MVLAQFWDGTDTPSGPGLAQDKRKRWKTNGRSGGARRVMWIVVRDRQLKKYIRPVNTSIVEGGCFSETLAGTPQRLPSPSGSNRQQAKSIPESFIFLRVSSKKHLKKRKMNPAHRAKKRPPQDSNLRGQSPVAFEATALTARPDGRMGSMLSAGNLDKVSRSSPKSGEFGQIWTAFPLLPQPPCRAMASPPSRPPSRH